MSTPTDAVLGEYPTRLGLDREAAVMNPLSAGAAYGGIVMILVRMITAAAAIGVLRSGERLHESGGRRTEARHADEALGVRDFADTGLDVAETRARLAEYQERHEARRRCDRTDGLDAVFGGGAAGTPNRPILARSTEWRTA